MVATPPSPPTPSPSLRPPTPEAALRLATWLRESGFHREGLTEALGSAAAPLPGGTRVPRLLARSVEARDRAPLGALGPLARWFLLGHPVPESTASEHVPAPILELLLACGMLARSPDGDRAFESRVLLEPHGDLLVASDTYQHLASPEGYDHVLASNPTARHLLDFTPRAPVKTALDLGTGCGIQALCLAAHADRVVATDLNPRAEGFVQLNAALNGLDNIETRTGDLWDAVAGETFDLVVCNPPFVLAPTREFLYRDSGLDLDGIVEAVVAGAEHHLAPGGHLHLIAEWVETEAERWDERIGGWMAASGCDGIVLRTHALDPEAYAEGRLREELGGRSTPEALTATWERWRAHHQSRGVRQIVGGLVALRKRAPGIPQGPPRLRFDPLDRGPYAGVGAEAHRALAVDDLLAAHPGSELLNARLAVAPDLVLETRQRPHEGGWAVDSHRLVREAGPGHEVELPLDMAVFAAGFGAGSRVGDRLASLRPDDTSSPPAPMVAEVLRVVRSLLQRGFLDPPPRRQA